jgi:hypothetical protein
MLGVHMKLRTYKGDTDPLLRVADSIAKVRPTRAPTADNSMQLLVATSDLPAA